jgi:hypothetical protein
MSIGYRSPALGLKPQLLASHLQLRYYLRVDKRKTETRALLQEEIGLPKAMRVIARRRARSPNRFLSPLHSFLILIEDIGSVAETPRFRYRRRRASR